MYIYTYIIIYKSLISYILGYFCISQDIYVVFPYTSPSLNKQKNIVNKCKTSNFLWPEIISYFK